ncbi:MAG: FAD-binding oxidoreductase [Cloacibacterium sp.]|nr:FAD-binding oxidoreductase [Cloacibacterium sp.]
MKKVDYIIVGDGYAGFFFAHQLIRNKKSFVIFSEGKPNASYVSAGMINPVILKRFTPIWLCHDIMETFRTTFNEIKEYLKKDYFVEENVIRIFHDEKEREIWNTKSEEEILADYMDKDFIQLEKPIINHHSCGKIKDSGRLKVYDFFDDMRNYLVSENKVIASRFDYAMLHPENKTYQNIHYQNIVFAEGTSICMNPYFSEVPVQPNKGHHLIIKLNETIAKNYAIKKKHFLFPLQDATYYYGSTYDRASENSEIDQNAVEELKNGLKQFYNADFEVEQIHTGFRATVRDRKPILGEHNQFKNVYILNGLGARGVLNGCFFSKELYEHIENKKPLMPEVDVKRFA